MVIPDLMKFSLCCFSVVLTIWLYCICLIAYFLLLSYKERATSIVGESDIENEEMGYRNKNLDSSTIRKAFATEKSNIHKKEAKRGRAINIGVSILSCTHNQFVLSCLLKWEWVEIYYQIILCLYSPSNGLI